MATVKEIPEKAGVSRAVVSRVLNGSAGVNPEKRVRVMEWGEEVGFLSQ